MLTSKWKVYMEKWHRRIFYLTAVPPLANRLTVFGMFDDLTDITKSAKLHYDRSRDFVQRLIENCTSIKVKSSIIPCLWPCRACTSFRSVKEKQPNIRQKICKFSKHCKFCCCSKVIVNFSVWMEFPQRTTIFGIFNRILPPPQCVAPCNSNSRKEGQSAISSYYFIVAISDSIWAWIRK